MSETTTSTDWMSEVKAVASLIEQEGPISETLGTLSEPLVEGLIESGLFAMQSPAELGGGGAGVVETLDVTEQVFYHNPSVGWNVLAVGVATATVGALLDDDDVARRMFECDPFPRMTGYAAPVGVATPVDGGYKLSGRFSFGSGIAQSTWVQVAAPDPHGSGSDRWLVVPIEDVKRLGNWSVYGLEATASEDFEVIDVFVPEEHTFLADGPVRRGQAYRRVGLRPVSAILQAAAPLGVARRALDEVRQLAPRKGRLHWPRVADQQMFRYDFGVHDAALRAAKALAVDAAVAAEQIAAEGRAPTSEETYRFVQACAYAHVVGAPAVRFAYEWGGTSALRRPSRLGRLYMDMAGVTQHVGNDPNLMADAGGAMIGLPLD